MYAAVVATPIEDVHLGIRLESQGLAGIEFLHADTPLQSPRSSLATMVCQQLTAYFSDPHFKFDLPLVAQGTAFRQQVWQAMRQIPVGQTRSYGQLAQQLNSSARAVGGACGANPVPIVVPCHRILAAHGCGGFMGATEGWPLAIKHFLLQHEGVALGG